MFCGSPSVPVLFENDEIIVLSKPASVPCYPTGPYDCNSLSEILKWEGVYGEVFRPVHRLDRLYVCIYVCMDTCMHVCMKVNTQSAYPSYSLIALCWKSLRLTSGVFTFAKTSEVNKLVFHHICLVL
jgi:hypothetical protein